MGGSFRAHGQCECIQHFGWKVNRCDNSKMDLREITMERVDWINQAQE